MGIGSHVGIINLRTTLVSNVLMKLGCRARELRILVGSEFFNLETIIIKARPVPGNSFLF